MHPHSALTLAALLGLACGLPGPTPARAYDEFAPRARRPAVVQEQRDERPPLRRYELIIKNRTYSPIITVYAKSVRMRNMSVDLIPDTTIQPGRQGLVELIDSGESCEWYIKAELADGSSADISMNVCTKESWTINQGRD